MPISSSSSFRLLTAACLAALAGCAVLPPTASDTATLVVAPRIAAGDRSVQAVVTPYTTASIYHLTIALNSLATGSPVLVQSADLAGSDVLSSRVTFSNLHQSTSYQIVATAYPSAGTAGPPISLAASSTLVVNTTTDTAPVFAALPVKLLDQPFAASGSLSGVAIGSGSWLPAGLVGTFAGSGAVGALDGTGTAATFKTPYATAIDPTSGNLYVADSGNNKIRMITPAGVVTTPALTTGTGYPAFNNPQGLTLDAKGQLYVADTVGQRIWKVAGGTAQVLAGSGLSGSADGLGTAASFSYPFGLAVDAGGNVYVADTHNSTIRKITPAGLVTTLATTTLTGSTPGFPLGLALDVRGNLYVADGNDNAILKVTQAGTVSRVAATGAYASFNYPNGIAVGPAGTLYVADTNNKRIVAIAPNGATSLLADSTALAAATIDSLAVDANGSLFLADQTHNTIVRIQ